MNQLIQKLQKEDRRMTRLIRGVKIMYLILIPIYTLLSLFAPDFTLVQRGGGILVVLGFIAFTVLFQRRINEFNSVDYALPTTQMLFQTMKRYKFWKPELPCALLAALLIDAGLCLIHVENFTDPQIRAKLLDIQGTMLPALLIGIVIGTAWWYLKHKPLHDQAQTMLNELMQE
ncbi:hypothetical protein [Mangrovibacterium marinum]|uniref:hypothetical protein n=1 Tax=Mangrovibacterium marinum TaxID=1639118 RepID=UPI002A18AC00|nr:hypothetical protein [Mangrovibacterium marinum]